MSFELMLIAPEPDTRAEAIHAIAAFLGKDHSATAQGLTYAYADASTEVSFTLRLADASAASDAVNVATIDVAYLRPSFFARQAFLLACSLASEARCLLLDPQHDDMPQPASDESLEVLLASWRAANEVAVASKGGNEPRMPERVADGLWAYNFDVPKMQLKLSEAAGNVFVPHIRVRDWGRRLETYALWSEGIPILIPPCETVLTHSLVKKAFGPAKVRVRGVPRTILAGKLSGITKRNVEGVPYDYVDPHSRADALKIFAVLHQDPFDKSLTTVAMDRFTTI